MTYRRWCDLKRLRAGKCKPISRMFDGGRRPLIAFVATPDYTRASWACFTRMRMPEQVLFDNAKTVSNEHIPPDSIYC
jgi:hypothetical protein